MRVLVKRQETKIKSFVNLVIFVLTPGSWRFKVCVVQWALDSDTGSITLYKALSSL